MAQPENDTATIPDPLAFVTAQYVRAVGRPADPRGLADGLARTASRESAERWHAELQSSAEAVAYARSSPQLPDVTLLLSVGPDRVFIQRAYVALTSLTPSPDLIDDAMKCLTAGQSRLDWLRGLRQSAAGRSHRAQLTDIHRLDLTGDELCGRASPDLSRLQAVSDEGFVYLAYQSLLGRTPDPSGRANYLLRLRAGESRPRLLQELAHSPEGRCRADVLGALGIPAGSVSRLPRRWLRGLRRYISALRAPFFNHSRSNDSEKTK